MSEATTFLCESCRREYPIQDRVNFHGTELCEGCYENETAGCDHCGERVWLEDSIRDSTTILCARCYDQLYTRCERCNRLIRYDDDVVYLDDDEEIPYCASCAEYIRDEEGMIQSYSYKPIPIFHGNGKRFLGVELEMDRGGEVSGNAVSFLRIANSQADILYCKHDGSLNDGMELVTHPMTLEYHQSQMPWEKLLDEAISLGYRSHQTSTCGLHVHVNRDSLGDTLEQQELVIARILFFVENNWNELLKFSRRTQYQMDQWAARYGRKDSPKEMLDHVKKSYAGRYTCVNLTNRATIEFRMFRGTLRYNTLIAALQLINAICEAAFVLSDDKMGRLTWMEFVSKIGNSDYSELVRYLKERRLYVSEPVHTEDEL